MSIWPLKEGLYSQKPVHIASWQPMEVHCSEPLAAMCRMQHLYVRTAACPIPRPLLVHLPAQDPGQSGEGPGAGPCQGCMPLSLHHHWGAAPKLIMPLWTNAICSARPMLPACLMDLAAAQFCRPRWKAYLSCKCKHLQLLLSDVWHCFRNGGPIRKFLCR